MPFTRSEGWEQRLPLVLEVARNRHYVLGEHDCFRLACAAVQALTGVDLWGPWAGRYKTKREARRLLAEYALRYREAKRFPDSAGAFTVAFSWLFGSDPVSPLRAHRGDIVEFRDPTGEHHLGVANGGLAAVLLEDGLAFVPLAACAHCWRIG